MKFFSKSHRYAFRKAARSVTQSAVFGAAKIVTLGGGALLGAAGIIGAVSPGWGFAGLGLIVAGGATAVLSDKNLDTPHRQISTTHKKPTAILPH